MYNNFRNGVSSNSNYGAKRDFESRTVLVKNIKFSMTDTEFYDIFSKCGSIQQSSLFTKENTTCKAGRVRFANDAEVCHAIEKYHQQPPHYFDVIRCLDTNSSNYGKGNRPTPSLPTNNNNWHGVKNYHLPGNTCKTNGRNADFNKCSACGESATLSFVDGNARYCSSACQMVHTSTHKQFAGGNKDRDSRTHRGRDNFNRQRERSHSQPPGRHSLSPTKSKEYVEASSFEDNYEDNDHPNFNAPQKKNVTGVFRSPEKFQTPKELQKPSIAGKFTLNNDYKEVVVAFFESLHSFYVISAEVDKIADYLQQSIDKEIVVKNPNVGDMVAARFRENNQWYRAMIQKVNCDGSCEVDFIDYGNIGSVISSEIRTLPSVLSINNVPKQAIHCYLANTDPKNSVTWTEKEIDNFENLVAKGQLKAKKIFQIEDLHFVLLSNGGGDIVEVSLTPSNCGKTVRFIDKNFIDFWKHYHRLNVSGMITAKISPGCFWIANNSPELEVQLDKLNHICNNYPANPKSSFELGSIVAARKSAKWCRAIILEFVKDEFWVQYLDFGDCEKVSEVKFLPEEFYFYPTSAVLLQAFGTTELDDYFDVTNPVTIKITGSSNTLSRNGEKKSFPVVVLNDDDCLYLATSVWYNIEKRKTRKKIEKLPKPCLPKEKVLSSESPINLFEDQKPRNSSSRPIASGLNNLSPGKEFFRKETKIKALPNIKELPDIDFSSLSDLLHVLPVICNADGIYVQLITDENEKYSHTLMDILQNLKPVATNKLTNLPVPSQILCGKSVEDNAWYRCSVVKVGSSSLIEVQYVDYGNKENLSLDRLVEAPPILLNYPPIAICVTLADIDKRLENMAWDELKNGNVWQMRVVNLQSNPIEVVMSNSQNVLLKNLIETRNDKTVSSLKSPQRNAMCSTPKENNSPNISTGSVSKLANPNEINKSILESFLYDETEIVKLPLGKKVIVQFVTAVAPLNMCCWFGDAIDIAEKLDELSYNLNQIIDKEKSTVYVPTEGELCLAKFSDDGWYRAVCMTPSVTSCNVLFVDFGNDEEVECRDLRPMRRDFMSLPIQGIRCCIKGVPDNIQFGPDKCKLFQELVPLNIPCEIEAIDFDKVGALYSIRIPSIESELRRLGFIR